jgi:copper chaperone CopZ
MLLSFTACERHKPEDKQKTAAVKKENISTAIINIEGMTCEGCEMALGQIPSKIDGVISFKASHVNKNAEVEFDKTVTDINKIINAVTLTGYKAIGYEDKDGNHTLEKSIPKASMKCGGDMKCGAGKCGGAK